jgi:hypothetical protein
LDWHLLQPRKRAEHIGVARVSQATSKAFNIVGVEAVATKGKRVIDGDPQGLFDGSVGFLSERQKVVDTPAFNHPSPGYRVNQTTCRPRGAVFVSHTQKYDWLSL